MNKRETAADLMAKLQKDPAFQARAADKENRRMERQAKYDESLAPVLSQLHSIGLRGNSLQEIVEQNAPLRADAVELLLAAIATGGDARPLESLVRALGTAELPFDGRVLVECFERTDDEALKWAIVNTIALSNPRFIDEWKKEKIANSSWGKVFNDLGVKGLS